MKGKEKRKEKERRLAWFGQLKLNKKIRLLFLFQAEPL
jgi:hypothetical protein